MTALRFRAHCLVALLLSAAPLAAQNFDCDGYLTTLVVTDGFCVRKFAEGVPNVRHLVLHPSGTLIAATNEEPGLLRIEVGKDGKAGKVTRFGPGMKGTGIVWQDDYLYFATDSLLVRYYWPAKATEPDTAFQGLGINMPAGGGSAHSMKGLALARDGSAFISYGSASDNCQTQDRMVRSLGQWPCRELEWRAGIWYFGPTDTPGKWQIARYASGLRNAEALAIDPVTGRLWAATHGRDFLGRYWGWDAERSANQPAEMLFEIKEGREYGWPYCMGNWTRAETKQIKAPEYERPEVDCTKVEQPVLGFPGHWAPMALAIPAAPLPAPLGRGIFVVFHGSSSRSPLPEDGHYIAFAPFDSTGTPQSPYRIFLRSLEAPGNLRMSGMAIGPDGVMYVGDDAHGRIFRIEPRRPTRRGPPPS